MNRLNQERLKTIGYQQKPTLTGNVNEQHGEGIKELKDAFIKKYLGNRPKVINDLIKNEGKVIINAIEVCRSPVLSIFEKLINFLSLGMLKRKMNELGYDRLFHLYVIVYLANGSIYRIEKNQRMNIIKNPKKTKKTECNKLDIKNRNLNLAEFITAPERVNMDNLYRYNAFKYNCQDYIKRLLNANGITQYDTFIMQKVEDLAQGVIKTISHRITDVAGVANYLYHGGGMEDKKKCDNDCKCKM